MAKPIPTLVIRRSVFLAHWVENRNWLLWLVRDLHKHPEHARRWFLLWPLCAFMSILYALGGKGYDEVDCFVFSHRKHHIWLLRNFGWQFFFQPFRAVIKRRILDAVLTASRNFGIKVIGLGALCKDAALTRGGEWIVEALGDKLTSWIVHGDTLTAQVVYLQATEILQRCKARAGPVFITGATSKIGRALVHVLAQDGVNVRMYTSDPGRFAEIQAELGNQRELVSHATSFSDGADCRLWITGKGNGGRALMAALPHGAVVLNFSVPDPLKPRWLRRRPDIAHLDGGLLAYPPEYSTQAFMMRLRKGLMYACHVGAIVHALMGWNFHEVGRIEVDRLEAVWRAAQELGFILPPPTSFLRPAKFPD